MNTVRRLTGGQDANMWIFISKHPTLDKNRKEGFLLEVLRCIDKNTLQFLNVVGEDEKKCISEYMKKIIYLCYI